MMPGPFSNFRILFQNGTQSLKRPYGRISNGIGYAVIRTSTATFGPHKIIFAIPHKHERTFDITLRRYFLKYGSIIKSDKTGKIIFQLNNIAMPPSAVDHIILPIFVLKNKLIDWLGTILKLVQQRFTKQILKRSLRILGHTYSDTSFFIVILNII